VRRPDDCISISNQPSFLSSFGLTYHCTSTTPALCTSQLRTREANPSQVLQHCDFWIRIVQCDLRPVEVEPQRVVKALRDLVEPAQRILWHRRPRFRLDKSRRHTRHSHLRQYNVRAMRQQRSNKKRGIKAESLELRESKSQYSSQDHRSRYSPRRMENAAIQPQSALSRGVNWTLRNLAKAVA